MIIIIPKIDPDIDPSEEVRADRMNQAHELIDQLSPRFKWQVEIKRYRKKRGNPANAYHWGVICKMISDDTGNDPTDIHEYLLGEHVGWETYEVFGNLKQRPTRRSHDMDNETFENFNEFCRAWAASNLAIVIPLPGEGDVHN